MIEVTLSQFKALHAHINSNEVRPATKNKAVAAAIAELDKYCDKVINSYIDIRYEWDLECETRKIRPNSHGTYSNIDYLIKDRITP